jgi:hypothetical protein
MASGIFPARPKPNGGSGACELEKKTQIFHREPRQIRETNRETNLVSGGGGNDEMCVML